MQVTARVPAKVNLQLNVGPLRPDGFHDLATLFHAVSLYDDVTVADSTGADENFAPEAFRDARGSDAAPEPVESAPEPNAEPDSATHTALEIGGAYARGVPVDASNLAVRAARALAEVAGVPARVRISVRKHIPVAAGLAGGSADAAGVLLACNELWGLHWPLERLSAVAATLGSDVPFSLVGGTAVGTGRGEHLEPVSVAGKWHWVLAVSKGILSTPRVYRRLDQLRASEGTVPAKSPAVDPAALEALADGEVEAAGPLLHNDMQVAAVDLYPPLAETLRAGRAAGALGGIVSGSGPTCVFLVRDAADARGVAEALGSSGTCATAIPVSGPVSPVIGSGRSTP